MAGRLTRFLNLEKRRPAREEAAHEVVTPGRFSPEPAGLQLSPDHGEQPFLRCPSCEADNGRFAVRCLNCSARLDTEAVHAFNDQLWVQRQAEVAAARAAEIEHQKELVVSQRALGEAIAQEVAERERARLGSSTPIGIRWLLQLEPGARTKAALSAVALFAIGVLVALFATRHPLLRTIGGGLALLLVSLFLPNRSRRFWD